MAGTLPSRRRPEDNGLGLGAFAAIVGGLIAGPAAAALAGLGGAALGQGRVPLVTALRGELEAVGCRLVAFEQPSRRHAVAVVEFRGRYFTATSTAPAGVVDEDLDDWLFGDLLDQRILPTLRPYVFTR